MTNRSANGSKMACPQLSSREWLKNGLSPIVVSQEKLKGLSPEQRAKLIGRAFGVVLYEVSKALLTAGAGTAIGALAKSGKFAKLYDRLSTFLPDESIDNIKKLLGAIRDNYWAFSRGISLDEARSLAKAHGFGFDIGRKSYFNNDRNAVIIGKDKLLNGQVNLIELAEEIQHGLDRATNEAGRFRRRLAGRGLSFEQLNNLFHIEHFERIIRNWEAGGFQFLTAEDIEDIRRIIEELK